MTFAQELRHAVTHEPARPPDVPQPVPRVTTTRVLEVQDGLPDLMRLAAGKQLFTRFPWPLMGLAGTPEDQVLAMLRRRDPSPAYDHTAIWLTEACARVFVRLSSREAFSSLVVGRNVNATAMREFCRAMYDVGIERFTGAMRKDHPYLQKAMGVIPGLTTEPHATDPESVTIVYPVDAKGARP